MNVPALTLASGSGNCFAYGWRDEWPAECDGASLARALCPGETGLGLDGLYLLDRPRAGHPWEIEHWEPDGAWTFCGNGTRTAFAIPGAPAPGPVAVRSNGQDVLLHQEMDGAIALRMPNGPECGFRESPLHLPQPHACAWIGNPQLIIEVPDVDAIDLAAFAPPLRHHPTFPEGTNVCIIQILEEGCARIRSWERGVEGETLSCGTGTSVAGAWLAQRTGRREWQFQPRGKDAVRVTADMGRDGRWEELWLAGVSRILGVYNPDPALLKFV